MTKINKTNNLSDKYLSECLDSKSASAKLGISLSSIHKLRKNNILMCHKNTNLITKKSFNKLKEIIDNYRMENGMMTQIPIESIIRILRKDAT